MARAVLLLCLALLCSCARVPPPQHIDNACAIFSEKPRWYFSSKKAAARWGIPTHIILAIIHQESRFQSDAAPPRVRFLGIIPGARASSAYGYSQALNETWRQYQKSTGNTGSTRADYHASADFIGWYCKQAVDTLRLKPTDAFHLYLAYHEGLGGYAKGTYRQRTGLIPVAHKVDKQAHRYENQIQSCVDTLPKSHWYTDLF